MDENTQKDDKKKDPTMPKETAALKKEIEMLQKKYDEAEQQNNLLKKELQKKDIELEESRHYTESLTETSKRALADLSNFRRRNEEEKKHFVQFANALLIQEILQITDNFERAFDYIPEELKKNDWIAGITQIEKKLKGILEKQGVKEISALGKKMNTEEHEAILTGPGKKDIVIEVLEKGYMMGNKVLRPTKVKVGDGTGDQINGIDQKANLETSSFPTHGNDDKTNNISDNGTDPNPKNATSPPASF